MDKTGFILWWLRVTFSSLQHYQGKGSR